MSSNLSQLNQQEIMFLYLRNKQELKEYEDFFNSTDGIYLDKLSEECAHYRLCKIINDKLEPIAKKIIRAFPKLYKQTEFILKDTYEI